MRIFLTFYVHSWINSLIIILHVRAFLFWQIDRNGNLWVLSDRLPIFMYSHLDLQDYNFRILTGSTEELIMGKVCAMTSPTYSTTMHDHRDHMDHMNHLDHMNHMDHMDHINHIMSTTPRFASRFNSGSSIKIESVVLAMMMSLTCLIEVLVGRV